MRIDKAIELASLDSTKDRKTLADVIKYVEHNMHRWYKPGDIYLEIHDLRDDLLEIMDVFRGRTLKEISIDEVNNLINHHKANRLS